MWSAILLSAGIDPFHMLARTYIRSRSTRLNSRIRIWRCGILSTPDKAGGDTAKLGGCSLETYCPNYPSELVRRPMFRFTPLSQRDDVLSAFILAAGKCGEISRMQAGRGAY